MGVLGFAMAVTVCVSLGAACDAGATLPDSRGYELVSPIEKNGLSPYAAVSATDGGKVDFQARGAFSEATWGSLNVYQAVRADNGWQTTPLTPLPPSPLGALEEQAPVWFSSDLSKMILTTPGSYDSGDDDDGALSLYQQGANSGLTWVSGGIQGSSERKQVTFDGATPDGNVVLFSTGASLVPTAKELSTGLFPEPEFLYKRDVADGITSLISLDGSGRQAGYAATAMAANYFPGHGGVTVTRTDGFAPGQFITIGTGEAAETTQVFHIHNVTETTEELVVEDGAGLPNSHAAGTPVVHLSEGAILGDGGHLTSGPSPAGEYVPADTESGSTTNAASKDGSRIFFESPSSGRGQPVGLYMRQDDATTVKVAGGQQYATILAEVFTEEEPLIGSARYEGAAEDGSLMFFTTDEGLGGAAAGKELYEFNTTGHEIGGVPAMSAGPVSAGLEGDRQPQTALAVGAASGEEPATVTVTSTMGFSAGEMVAFGAFENSNHKHDSGLTAVIAAIKSATELTLTSALSSGGGGVPAGTTLHGVHPASMVAVSNDGAHVYFISDGVLAANQNSEGATATPLRPNLYVFDTATGGTTFIATVAGSDVQTAEGTPRGLVGEPDISRPAVPSPDGKVLVFLSTANVTGQNPWEEFREVYRYSVADESLTCLSCTASGVKPTGDASFGETAGGTYDPPGLSSPMSEEGSRVFFQSPDSLVPADTNGAAPPSAKFETPTSTDVYEWSASGGVGLISSGKSANPSVLQGTTPSGDDVLFTTTAQLVPQDTDGGYENVFDARVGGGFPAGLGTGAPSCVGASCRAAFGVAPVAAVPGSLSPQSAGSPRPVVKPKRKPLTCRKGFVKKRVKGKLVCARRKPGKARRAGRAAGRIGRGVGG